MEESRQLEYKEKIDTNTFLRQSAHTQTTEMGRLFLELRMMEGLQEFLILCRPGLIWKIRSMTA